MNDIINVCVMCNIIIKYNVCEMMCVQYAYTIDNSNILLLNDCL